MGRSIQAEQLTVVNIIMKILLASNNQAKISEIKALLDSLPIEIIPQNTLNIIPAEETGLTFIENALLKARQGSKYSQLPCFGEDSGLCVDILQGAPGIYSARYAGIDVPAYAHTQKLLKALEFFESKDRQAHYSCTIVLVQHENDPEPFICQAQWHGEILTQPRGTQGFGYDPIFLIPTLHCSAAELSLEQKNTVSHRAQALALLIEHLKKMYLK